jgi:uncharacterized repeat protein (TIGR01451 family)
MVNVEVHASGTGIGIRLDGPDEAQVGQTIYYTITVTNLGDFWDRNITLTNQFPDGTLLSIKIPDLAPLLQVGHEYSITAIPYTIKPGDLSPQSPAHIDDIASVSGYVNVSGIESLVLAETDFPTIIIPPPVVGGYAVLLEPKCPRTPSTIYFSQVFAISATALSAIIAASVCLLFRFKHARIFLKGKTQIVKFERDWEGNGTYFDARTNPIATYAYEQIGVYYPTLRVTDNDGLTNETTKRIVVSSPSFLVGGYSVSLETAYPQTPSILYAILALVVAAASVDLDFQLKHIRISLRAIAEDFSPNSLSEQVDPDLRGRS